MVNNGDGEHTITCICWSKFNFQGLKYRFLLVNILMSGWLTANKTYSEVEGWDICLSIYLSIYLSIVLYICIYIYIHHFCKIWNLYIYDYMHIHIYCVWINKYIYIYMHLIIYIYIYIDIWIYCAYLYIYVYIWPHCAIGLHPCHDIPGSLPEVSAHAWPEFDLFPGDSGWRKLMKSGKEPKLWRDLWKRMYPLVI